VYIDDGKTKQESRNNRQLCIDRILFELLESFQSSKETDATDKYDQ